MSRCTGRAAPARWRIETRSPTRGTASRVEPEREPCAVCRLAVCAKCEADLIAGHCWLRKHRHFPPVGLNRASSATAARWTVAPAESSAGGTGTPGVWANHARASSRGRRPATILVPGLTRRQYRPDRREEAARVASSARWGLRTTGLQSRGRRRVSSVWYPVVSGKRSYRSLGPLPALRTTLRRPGRRRFRLSDFERSESDIP